MQMFTMNISFRIYHVGSLFKLFLSIYMHLKRFWNALGMNGRRNIYSQSIQRNMVIKRDTCSFVSCLHLLFICFTCSILYCTYLPVSVFPRFLLLNRYRFCANALIIIKNIRQQLDGSDNNNNIRLWIDFLFSLLWNKNEHFFYAINEL